MRSCHPLIYAFIAVICVFLLSSCENSSVKLPIYGPKTVAANGTDSIEYRIPAFVFVNQDSQLISEKTMSGKTCVVDFFFTACPSICPKMKKEMLRVYDKYRSDSSVIILSFSIDPARDSVARLHAYAQKLGIESDKWHLLTGDKKDIYSIAEKFLVSAAEDPDAPGGHVHSGNFILVDKNRRLRGYYDGVQEQSVDKLLMDMDVLLQEKE